MSLKESSSCPSEEDNPHVKVDSASSESPLEVYESAILKERQGSLSEAVIQYRKAFKVYLLQI